MSSLPSSVLYCLVSLLYFGVAIYAWWRQNRILPDAAAVTIKAVSPIERGGLLLALLLHGVLLHQIVFAPDGLHFGFAYALSAMLWLGVLLYWVESFTLNLPALPLLLLPL